MKRNNYDLSHYSIMAGRMGRLQTLSTIPIVAGDSMSVAVEGVFRLSPLRRNLTLDAMVDLFAFYIPHRHIYPEFVDLLMDGVDETITLPNGPTPSPDISCYGTIANFSSGNPMPLWMCAGYNRIWNRYFRDPTDDVGELADGILPTDTDSKLYGHYICKPKSIWTTGMNSGVLPDAADRSVAVTNSAIDILDLNKVKARYKTELQREYFGNRYNDLMKGTYGSGVNIDADQRPQLIMRSSQYLSGYDVDGTSDQTLGSYSGKAASTCRLHIPRKFFNEHGTLWIMAALRFPVMHQEETHYLFRRPNPSYAEVSGDPDIISSSPPVELKVGDVFAKNSNSNLGHIPYAQWYRTHPSVMHGSFKNTQGFPFLTKTPVSRRDALYYGNSDYDSVFQNTSVGHWQSQSLVSIDAQRVIPSAAASIFAGAS